MKRFLLFSGDLYYPLGGIKDFKGSFDTKEEALDWIAKYPAEWYHIYDTEEQKVVVGVRDEEDEDLEDDYFYPRG